MIPLFNSSLKKNLYSFYEDFIGFEDFICKKSSEYDCILSDKYQWPGYVYNIRTGKETCSKLVTELKFKISTKDIPPFLLVSQEQVPEDFEELMYQAGIRKVDYWPVIYIDLKNNLPELKRPPDFNIVEFHDETRLQLWYNIVVPILFPGKTTSFDFFRHKLNDKRYLFYLGYYKNLPVTTCMFFMDNNIAGAYMGATINEFRCKGFGKEIVRRGFSDTARVGCDYATAQSVRMEVQTWQKIGFSIANTIDIYWKLEY